MSAVLSLVQRPDPDMLDEIMDSVVSDELWPKRRREPVSLLEDLHRQGSEIYLISAAYQPAVDIFAKLIAPNRTYGIGTPVEITPNGLRLAGPLNSRDKKMSNLLGAIGPRNLDLALGDTFADIPLLERSQDAIAVHPDRKLRKTALKRGWKIIE